MLQSRFPLMFGLAALILVNLAAEESVLAQTTISPGAAIGYPSGASLIGDSIANVQVENGNLHIEIPLMTISGRGNIQLPYKIVYDSKGWTNNIVCTPVNDPPYTSACNGSIIPLPGLPSSFRFSSPFSYAANFQETDVNPNDGCVSHFSYQILEPRATTHSMTPTNLGYAACNNNGTPGPLTGYATDGSGWSILLNSDDSVNSFYDSNGTAYTPNIQTGSLKIEDTNGNVVSYAGNSSLTAIDTLGRTIPAGPTPTGSPSLPSPPATLSYLDSNGDPQTITLTYTTTTLQTALCPFSGITGTCAEYGGGDPTNVLQSISFPNGQAYTIAYAQDQYAQPLSLTLPTGAKYSWTWGSPIDSSGPMVASQSVTVSGTTYQTVYTPATKSASPEPGYFLTAMTVVDPNKNKKIYTMAANTVLPQPGPSGVVKEQDYGTTGTLIKTVGYSYSYLSGDVSPDWDGLTTTTTWNQTGEASRNQTIRQVVVSNQSNGNYGTVFSNSPASVSQSDYNTRSSGWLTVATSIYLQYPHASYLQSQTISDGAGNQLSQATYEYDKYNHSGQSMAASGAVNHDSAYSTTFTKRGNVTGVSLWLNTSSSSLTSTYGYDDAGQVVSFRDPANNPLTQYSYIDSWDASGGQSSSCEPSGKSDAYLTKVTDSLGHVSTSQYYPCSGLVAEALGPNDIAAGDSGTQYTYDLLNRLTLTQIYGGGETKVTYNDSAMTTDTETWMTSGGAKKYESLTQLDGLGRITQTELVSDATSPVFTTQSYDGVGHTIAKSNPYRSGDTVVYTQYKYQDALGRLTSVINPDTSSIGYSYTGAAVEVADASNGFFNVARITQSDSLSRAVAVCEITNAAQDGTATVDTTPTTCGLNIAGTGFLTTYAYQYLNATNNTPGYAGPGYYQIIAQGDLPEREELSDSLGRPVAVYEPESGMTSLSYDNDGNIHTRTKPSPNQSSGGSATVVTTYSYDAVNRLTDVSYVDGYSSNGGLGLPVHYDYDGSPSAVFKINGAKNMIGMLSDSFVAGPTGTNYTAGHAYSYDILGRPVQMSECTIDDCQAGWSYMLTTGFDYTSNITSLQLLDSYGINVTLSYTYNNASQLTQISSTYIDATHPAVLWSSGSYTAMGEIKSANIGTDEAESYSYDTRGHMNSGAVTGSGGVSLYSVSIPAYVSGSSLTGYAPNGSIVSAVDSVNGTWAYTYDSFNRLTSAQTGGSKYQWNYDRFGNNCPGAPASCTSQNSPNNRLTALIYDAAGNVINDGLYAYTYDDEDRLTVVTGASSLTGNGVLLAQYAYDADGRRIRRYTTSFVGAYVYDVNGVHVADMNTNGSLILGEIYGGGRHIATYNASTNSTLFIHSDWLGTERARSLYNGTAYQTCSSHPFGDSMSCQPAAGVTGYIDPSPVHFTGQERDGETGGEAGNDFFSARYYSSGWARFMSPDPSGLSLADQSNPQTFNLYTYVLNNPINRVDPSGLGKCRSPNGLPVSPITSEGFNYDDIQDAFTCVISGGSWELDSSDNSCSIGSSTPWPCANGGNTPPVTEAINPPSPTASTGSSTSSTAPTDSQLPQIDDSGIEFPTFSGATLIGGGIAGAGGVQITNPLLLTVATQTAPKPAGPSNGPMIRIATSNYIFNGMHGNECEYMLFCPNGNTQSTCGAQAPAVLMEGPPVNPCRNYLHDSRLVVNGKCVPVGSAQLSSLPVDCN